MSAARILTVVAAIGVIAVGFALTRSDADDRYHLSMRVANAAGLQDGSPVVVGGVPVGRVDVSLRPDGKVDLDLQIKQEHAPVGRDAALAVRAINLLGQKQLQLVSSADTTDPAPSGYRLRSSRFTVSTDLDQTLDVLDPDTRVRLGILLNEAGLAVSGRRQDITELIAELPGGLTDVKRVVDAVNSDNRALRRLVNDSARAIGAFNGERGGLRRMIDTLGRTTTTVSARRLDLEDTVERAPGTLATLRRVLGRLDRLTVPAKPAARLLAETAPELSAALSQVPAFQRAAVPTLDKATRVAGDISTLADKATPVLRRTVPVSAQVAKLTGESLPPVTATLNKSVDNVFAILDNWSRAIQFRDGLGHIFRGSASVSPDMVDSLIRRALPATTKARKKPVGRKPGATPDRAPAAPERPRLPTPQLPRPKVGDVLSNAVDAIKGLLSPGGRPDAGAAKPPSKQPARDLLDYLLKP